MEFIKKTIKGFLNENISKREFDEMKDYFKNGGVLQNDAAGYHIFIRRNGTVVQL